MKVIATTTLAVATWTPAWSAVIAVGSDLYGLSATGLERLAGPIEATATPYVESGKLNLAPGHSVNVPRAYALVQSSGPLELTATPDVQGREVTVKTRLPARPGAQERERTVSLPRGPEGVAWKFRLGSPAGAVAPWSVSSLSVLPARVRPVR